MDIVESTAQTSRSENPEDIAIGQWYWVKDKHWVSDEQEYEEYEWLGCVMHIGSNYIKLHAPKFANSYRTSRTHFRDFYEKLRFEPNADEYIRNQHAHYQEQVNTLLGKIQAVTQRLGVVPTESIADQSGGANNALAVISEQVDTEKYKNQLVKAKDEELPALFKQVEEAHQMLAGWMTAPTLPTKAQIGPMKDGIGAIEQRIYTISLYAGLTESAVQVAEGEAAPFNEKLRVMQRRLYMDEECLANFDAGGMDITGLEDFDRWLCNTENRDRLLPFDRCVAAFRVRRHEKDREGSNSVSAVFERIQLRDLDKSTYLYVRNGDNLWRIACDFEFDQMIFPDSADINSSQPMRFKMFCGKVDKMIPESLWQVEYDKATEADKLSKQWRKDNPDESWVDDPYVGLGRNASEWEQYERLDPSSVYFDEGTAYLDEQIKRYNRIAVILQGLFDRSPVLHPHPPVQVWDNDSFQRHVELVPDATTLTYGEAPDFEEYRARLNASIDENSVLTGQDDAFTRREAIRENERHKRDWRNAFNTNYTHYRPYGNPGPVKVGVPDKWMPRARKAVFRWERESSGWPTTMIPCSIKVADKALLNVSAYKPGDFKQFFADPRTRQEYLKWAPLLMAAEEYHANGKT